MSERIETFHDGKVTLYCGDCLDVLPAIEAQSIDSCVCDPPYGYGFMGKAWDHGVPGVAYWKKVFRVLKPGAHLLAFGGTRTFGRMHVAIEDAGFEIRDMISWLYGSGFPKSLDVSKAIDKAAGAEREVVGKSQHPDGMPRNLVPRDTGVHEGGQRLNGVGLDITAPATDAARQWAGFGTALKPACEPIVLARKPLIGTVAENVLQHGTGALNIDGCRVGLAADENVEQLNARSGGKRGFQSEYVGAGNDGKLPPGCDLSKGRWPANVITDGSEEVVAAFPETHSAGAAREDPGGGTYQGSDKGDWGNIGIGQKGFRIGDAGGSAARFFYTAKADADDRLGSKHPTVKPLDLMQYLVRLVTPPGGLVLDPFAGTGTTGEAAWREGMSAVLIEREEEYQNDIRRRMKLAMSGPEERTRESIKARTKDNPADHGPLFGGIDTPPPAAQADRFTATSPIRTDDWPDRTQVVTE